LGGSYSNHYEYDNLYRLIHAEGNSGNQYTLDMAYSPNGKILHKTQTAKYSLNGSNYSATVDNNYSYFSETNQLNTINNNGKPYFKWDANGNMLAQFSENGARYHCWDEENRLMAFTDEKTFGYYLYDAGGQRAYKLSGVMGKANINGYQYGQPKPEMATLYASAYLVATPKSYTKHYYAGNDRIVSKIGGGGLSDIKDPIGNWQEKQEQEHDLYKKLWIDCLTSFEPEMHGEVMLYKLHDYTAVQYTEKELYFYHPDHLGSAAWITDKDGKAIQHLQYLPFGEPRIDQRTASWNTMFTFSGKERDEESSYSYFGARYYDSDISIWLSVDPRASSYPGLTPYNYCMNSPVMYTDPNGEFWVPILVGAIVGTVMGACQGYLVADAKGATGWAMFGYIMGGATIGAAAGAASGAAGGAVGSALATAGVGGFAGGAVSGGIAGAVGGFMNGAGMAALSGQSFGNSLLAGLKGAGIGMAAGIVMGGLMGGLDALKSGGRFLDGATVESTVLTPNQKISEVGQRGDYNCFPASAEAVDKSFEGFLTQEEIRNFEGLGGDPWTDALNAQKGWKTYCSKTGHIYGDETPGINSPSNILSKMQDNYRVSINTRIAESDIGHTVVMQRIESQTITKVNGNVIQQKLYYIMNPDGGYIAPITEQTIVNSYRIFYIK
jgi:RHS repeat-associated protein